ncbi:MAG: hypothetical protein MZU91_02120 [Desulfosudis oleivorans]|nr:hypothetical protein [Desulfosudis oleivorans]
MNLPLKPSKNGLVCARKSRNQRANPLILTGLGDLYVEVEEFEAAAQAYRLAETAAGDLAGLHTQLSGHARAEILALAQGILKKSTRS